MTKEEKFLEWKSTHDPEKMSTLEIKSIIEDLYNHKIELEMQNEELLRTQVELEITKQKYFDLYDLAPIGYCTIDRKGVILESNLKLSYMLKEDRKNLIKQFLSRYILPEDHNTYYLFLSRAISSESAVCEVKLKNFISVKLNAISGDEYYKIIVTDISSNIKTSEENMLLYRELNHRLKNSITLIESIMSISVNKEVSKESKRALQEMSLKIKSILDIYSIMQVEDQKIKLDFYCSKITNSIKDSVDYNVITRIDEITVQSKKAAIIGLVMIELVTNANKYAFPSNQEECTIAISVTRSGEKGVLAVIDNGVGVPEIISSGAGLNIVRGLADQLNASFQIMNNNPGTKCVLVFPLEAE